MYSGAYFTKPAVHWRISVDIPNSSFGSWKAAFPESKCSNDTEKPSSIQCFLQFTVNMARTARLIRGIFGHKGGGQPLLLGHFPNCMFGQCAPVGHLNRFGWHKVHLLLTASPF